MRISELMKLKQEAFKRYLRLQAYSSLSYTPTTQFTPPTWGTTLEQKVAHGVVRSTLITVKPFTTDNIEG